MRGGQIVSTPNGPGLEVDPFILSDLARLALSAFVGEDYCDLSARAQSAYVELGGTAQAYVVGVGRQLLGCAPIQPEQLEITDACVTAGPGIVCYSGGQCPTGRYIGELRWEATDIPGQVRTLNFNYAAPLGTFRIGEGGGVQFIQYFPVGGSPELIFQTGGGGEIFGVSISGITPIDGATDDCGDQPIPVVFPPPPPLPPPPAPGERLQETKIYNVNLEIEGNSVSVSVQVGPVVFNPERGLEVELMPGLPDVVIAPDLSIQVDDPAITGLGVEIGDLSVSVGGNGQQLDQVSDDVACLRSEICTPYEFGGTIVGCSGETSYATTGTAFTNLAQGLSQALEALSGSTSELCPVPVEGPSPAGELMLIEYAVNDGNEEGFAVALSADVVSVRVELDFGPLYSRVIRGTSTGDPTGRFGYVTFGLDYGAGVLWEPVRSQWYRQGYYDVPKFPDADRFVRIASYGGITVRVFDTGQR